MEIPNITKNRIIDYLNEGKRFDNRKLLDYRKISIELGISNKSEGSARIKLGNTEVICGVKLDVSEPYTDSEESGTLITTMELLPLASSKFEAGPPRIESIELARIVDRSIRESGFINFEKLCIKKGEKVWGIFLDLYAINDAGNLIDASVVAAVAALHDAVMPKYDEKEERVKYGEWTSTPLPLTESIPLTITSHKLGKSILLDPVSEEEETSEARLSFAFTHGKKEVVINACQKGNSAALSTEEVEKIIDIAEKKFKTMHDEIIDLLKEAKKERGKREKKE